MESTLLESGNMEVEGRLYRSPAFGQFKYHLKVHLNNVGDLNDMECDDIASQTVNLIGDFWRVFIRLR